MISNLNPFAATSGRAFEGARFAPRTFGGQFDVMASEIYNADSFVKTLRKFFSSEGAKHIRDAFGAGPRGAGNAAANASTAWTKGNAIFSRAGGLSRPLELIPGLVSTSGRGLADMGQYAGRQSWAGHVQCCQRATDWNTSSDSGGNW